MQQLGEAQSGSDIKKKKQGVTWLELEKLTRNELNTELEMNITKKAIQECWSWLSVCSIVEQMLMDFRMRLKVSKFHINFQQQRLI